MKSEPTTLMCYLVADGSPRVQSVIDSCAICGAGVWRALSSPQTDRVLCYKCCITEWQRRGTNVVIDMLDDFKSRP